MPGDSRIHYSKAQETQDMDAMSHEMHMSMLDWKQLKQVRGMSQRAHRAPDKRST